MDGRRHMAFLIAYGRAEHPLSKSPGRPPWPTVSSCAEVVQPS
jgi:hypothetical protein